jgi:hypothetical protein
MTMGAVAALLPDPARDAAAGSNNESGFWFDPDLIGWLV